MMEENFFKKIFIMSIIVLFVGTTVIPSIASTTINIDSNVSNKGVLDWPPGDCDIIVPDDYPTIQEAIDAAQPGYCICVRNGTYVENIEIKDKLDLTIIGENKETTIIDGNGQSDCMSIFYSSKLNFTNFTIQNCGYDPHFNQIIEIFSTNDTMIYNCNLKNCNGWVIGILYTTNITIKDCMLTDTKNGIIFQDKNYNNNIINCTITTGMIGIELWQNSSNNYLEKNNIIGNIIGILLIEDTITKNIITKNNIKNNKLFGILILRAKQNIIYNNNFINNGLIIRCHAIDIKGENQFHYDERGNYWRDYFGFDITPRDGIGDRPYFFINNKDPYPLKQLV